MCAILTEDLYILCKNGEHLSSYYTVADVSWFVSSFTIKCFPNFLLESTILLNICRVLPSYKSHMSLLATGSGERNRDRISERERGDSVGGQISPWKSVVFLFIHAGALLLLSP